MSAEDCTEEVKPCPCRDGRLPCEFEEDVKSAETVCKYCGIVGWRIPSMAQGKIFDNDDEKNLRADEGKSIGSFETTMSRNAFNANASALSAGFTGPDHTLQFKKRTKAKERTKEKYLHVLKDQCARMGFKGKTVDECQKLFVEYADKASSLAPKKMPEVMLGVIFYALNGPDQRRITELEKQTGISQVRIRNGMKLIEKVCNVSQYKRRIDPANLIRRYCQRLLTNKESDCDSSTDPTNRTLNVFVANAQVVAEYVNQYLEGKKPNTVAATDIILTYRWFYKSKFLLDESEIANLADVTFKTLKDSAEKVLQEMKREGLDPSAVVADAESRHIS